MKIEVTAGDRSVTVDGMDNVFDLMQALDRAWKLTGEGPTRVTQAGFGFTGERRYSEPVREANMPWPVEPVRAAEFSSRLCYTCGPTTVDPHPRVEGVGRCRNCKEPMSLDTPANLSIR